MSDASVTNVIKQNLSGLPPYKLISIGNFKLKRSVIPSSDCDRVVFYLDHNSNLHLSAKALSLGLTSDELLRQLVWSID